PRTNDWLLITSPMPGLTIMGTYLYFVLSWGPRYMQHRKPYDLTNTLILYNMLQVFVSVYLFYEIPIIGVTLSRVKNFTVAISAQHAKIEETRLSIFRMPSKQLIYCKCLFLYQGLDAAWLRKYSWQCQPVDFSNSPEAMRVARGVYIYFLAKISELLDTVFFVLRKKEKQITFLHMYHHTVMPMISWGCTKYYPGGHGTFIGVINSFVHIIMYFYYMMSAMGPQYQKYLWWKKYITTLQMGQFCVAFLHSFQLLFHDCEYPRWSLFFILPNAIFFYYLFNDFYGKAYESSRKKGGSKQS
ncbi:hypothetical protein ANN_12142, partial [Periplaneta americana]